MAAFLVSSGASSYSFRFPANGICFFFLLAVASRELLGLREEAANENPNPNRSRHVALFAGVIVTVSMITFCLLRANSIRHMTDATAASEKNEKIAAIENAISIDRSEPIFHFYKGLWLQQSGDNAASIDEIRISIDNGLANSTSFFRLAATQVDAGRIEHAEKTYREALGVYPRSVFLRTAYAAFLKRNGEHTRAETEYQSALLVNEKQARSWQLAHDEGLERLAQISQQDERYVSTFDLMPEDAPLVVAHFERRPTDALP
jgi:tetratricopeptide (TPR) repeat protein